MANACAREFAIEFRLANDIGGVSRFLENDGINVKVVAVPQRSAKPSFKQKPFSFADFARFVPKRPARRVVISAHFSVFPAARAFVPFRKK
jgi:hypothetical protein